MENENKTMQLSYIDKQILKLKEKGVRFNGCTEAEAKAYLTDKCCAFKAIAYRKLFDVYVGGENDGKYIDLDFAQLKYLAAIDQNLREILLDMTLDIEHFCKTQLLSAITEEDGYAVMAEYMATLEDRQLEYINHELARSINNPYSGNIVEHYKDNMPIWAFVEVMSFGTLVSIIKYYGERQEDENMIANYYVLRSVQALRNACAHGSCILLNLEPRSAGKRVCPPEVQKVIASLGVSKRQRTRWLQTAPVAQIASLLYLYSQIVPDGDTRNKRISALRQFFVRIDNFSAIPRENLANAALLFIKRLTLAFNLIN